MRCIREFRYFLLYHILVELNSKYNEALFRLGYHDILILGRQYAVITVGPRIGKGQGYGELAPHPPVAANIESRYRIVLVAIILLQSVVVV